jgi:acyl dehydratase
MILEAEPVPETAAGVGHAAWHVSDPYASTEGLPGRAAAAKVSLSSTATKVFWY